MRVEIFKGTPDSKPIAIGEISENDAKEMGLVWADDDVIRLSSLLWEVMIPEAKDKFLMMFNASET